MIMQSDIVLDNRVEKSYTEQFHIAKADEDQRLVFGWALVSERTDGETIIDHQGDIVDPDELEKGAYEYVLNFRDAGEEHIGTLRKKAKMVESCVFTPEKMKALGIPEGTVPVGWWIGFHVDDDDTWEKIKNGTYNMFSIEGKAVREPVDEPVTKSAYDEWLESNLDNFSGEKDERDFANWKSKHGKPKYATDIDVVDMLYEEYRGNTVAKSFSEIVEKFNPYHDSKGRFTSGSGGNYASFTYAPGKSKAHDNAIARERERAASSGGGVKAIRVTAPDGTTMTYRDRGNGHITDLDGDMPKNTNNLSIKQIHERAKQMGYKVETFDDKQLGQHDSDRAANRKQTDQFLNYHDTRGRGPGSAPRKGWKGH